MSEWAKRTDEPWMDARTTERERERAHIHVRIPRSQAKQQSTESSCYNNGTMNKCVYWVGVFLLNMLCYLSWLGAGCCCCCCRCRRSAAAAAAATTESRDGKRKNFVHARRAYTLAFASHTCIDNTETQPNRTKTRIAAVRFLIRATNTHERVIHIGSSFFSASFYHCINAVRTKFLWMQPLWLLFSLHSKHTSPQRYTFLTWKLVFKFFL